MNDRFKNMPRIKNLMQSERYSYLANRYGLAYHNLIKMGSVQNTNPIPIDQPDPYGNIPVTNNEGNKQINEEIGDPIINENQLNGYEPEYISQSTFFSILSSPSVDEQFYSQVIPSFIKPFTIIVRFDSIDSSSRFGIGLTTSPVNQFRVLFNSKPSNWDADKIGIVEDYQFNTEVLFNKSNLVARIITSSTPGIKYLGLRVDEFGNIAVGSSNIFWTNFTFTKIGNLSNFNTSPNFYMFLQFETPNLTSIDGEILGLVYGSSEVWGSDLVVENSGNTMIGGNVNPPTGNVEGSIPLEYQNSEFFGPLDVPSVAGDFYTEILGPFDAPSTTIVHFQNLDPSTSFGVGITDRPITNGIIKTTDDVNWHNDVLGYFKDNLAQVETYFNKANEIYQNLTSPPDVNKKIAVQVDQDGNISIGEETFYGSGVYEYTKVGNKNELQDGKVNIGLFEKIKKSGITDIIGKIGDVGDVIGKIWDFFGFI